MSRLSRNEILKAIKDELEKKLVTEAKTISYVGYYKDEFSPEKDVDLIRQYNFPAIYITYDRTQTKSAATNTRDKELTIKLIIATANFDEGFVNIYGTDAALDILEDIQDTLDGKSLGLEQKGLNQIIENGDFIIGVENEIALIGADYKCQFYYEV